MDFSIGAEIKKKVKERGLTNLAFGERMNIEERNLYHFFKKKEMTIDQLLDASEILEFDFVNLYIRNKKSASKVTVDLTSFEPRTKYRKETQQKITCSLKIVGSLESLQSAMPDLLKIINSEAEARGLQLG